MTEGEALFSPRILCHKESNRSAVQLASKSPVKNAVCCKAKHLEGFVQICIQQHRGGSRKEDLHNKEQELWAGTFGYKLPCCEVS